MKINGTAKTESAAREILAYLQDNVEETQGRINAVVSVSEDGDLLFYNAACGTDDSEIVLIARFECDYMGEGWESATTADVIEWFESNYEGDENEDSQQLIW